MTSLQDWLSTEQAAQLAGYHPNHIRRLIRSGEIEGQKWGNAWMINKSSLLFYKSRMEIQGERRGPRPNESLRKENQ